jgi:CubicO group peptidase (beta-lactamase class C family)
MIRIGTFLLLIAALSFQASAQNTSSKLDHYMQAQAKVNEFSGVVLIAKKEVILYKQAFGFADRELNVRNTVDTKFQIGSITKQFTAASILQLVEQGKLSLDDKLIKYFPDFPKGDAVTLHMLLNHTSGIKDYTTLPEFWRKESLPFDHDQMISLFKNQPYDFLPGTKFNYSSSGYYLLGVVVEKLSQKSYSRYVLDNLILKTGLENTFVNRWDTIVANRAKGYSKTKEGWKNAGYISMEGPYSAGAMISTVDDLYRWNTALFKGKVLSKTSFDLMTTPYLEYYGYGLEIDSLDSHFRIAHTGRISGFTSYLSYYPKTDVTVVTLSNDDQTYSASIARALAAIVFNLEVSTPYKPKEIALDTTLAKRYAGVYQEQNTTLPDSITYTGGRLFCKPWWKNRDLEMKAESQTKFYLAEYPEIQFEFETNSKGNVTKAYCIDAGFRSEMKVVGK